MDERGTVRGRGRDEPGSSFGWSVPAVVVAVLVWPAFGPFGSLWLYALGWTVALAAGDGLLWLLRRQGRAVPPPGRLVARLLRLGPESWLVAPGWARVRLAAGGFVVFAVLAGYMGRQAGLEYQAVADLRDHGRRTDATVVEVTDRSEEGRALSVAVRFDTPSGPVRAEVDIPSGSADDARPGADVRVAYDPARPSEVRQVAFLDGREADGIRTGAIVVGLLAAGFLVGATREVLRAKGPTEPGGAAVS
ncbi:DUF3592 domain-containing protein [Streptomyces sp. IBSBF 3136]|uniref:DUF3592 domain-containing protein n=1 Tax=Streptomyces sp. IBSBF 3136 TaxID=2903524 RepID=UPI002FDC31E9